ncbi:MAG TPA: FtsX-like permease family protein, partial [Nocardioides sp.]|nr:FtsX-like permease family protein [Nocardioides sp.]
VTMGLRFALERGRGRTATPVRPALLGAVVGVIGVVAVGVFGHGVRDAVDHPERFGETYQAFGFVGFQGHDFVPAAQMAGALDAMPEVTGIDDAHAQVADFPHGTGSVQLWSWDPGTKPLATTVLDGRMPESSNEVALGWLDMKRQGLEVGDTTELTSGSVTRTYTVVGRTLMPEGPHNGYDESGWITRAGYDQLFTADKFHVLFVSLAPDARNPAGLARINQAVFAALPNVKAFAESQCRGNSDPTCLWAVNTPASQQLSIGTNGVTESLRQTRELPYLLAAFLILLAVAAIAHALVSAVRRRAVDLAVLRAGGMTPAQSRTIVVVQACALAVVGLVFGLPLGIALGRTAWRWIAFHFPLQYVAPGDLVLVLATIPAVVVIVNLLAALPARRAARAKVAAILRAE